MAALPGLTTTSLTKERTKALVSVSSLVLRNSLISFAKAAMVSALSSTDRRSAPSTQKKTESFARFTTSVLPRYFAAAPPLPVLSSQVRRGENVGYRQGWCGAGRGSRY